MMVIPSNFLPRLRCPVPTRLRFAPVVCALTARQLPFSLPDNRRGIPWSVLIPPLFKAGQEIATVAAASVPRPFNNTTQFKSRPGSRARCRHPSPSVPGRRTSRTPLVGLPREVRLCQSAVVA